MVWTAHNLPPTQTVATHYNKAFMFGQHATNLTLHMARLRSGSFLFLLSRVNHVLRFVWTQGTGQSVQTLVVEKHSRTGRRYRAEFTGMCFGPRPEFSGLCCGRVQFFFALVWLLLWCGLLASRFFLSFSWLVGFLASWLLGFLASWLFGFLASWLFGFLASWLFGFVASWLLGFLAFGSNTRIAASRCC